MPLQSGVSPPPPTAPALEVAHILFMDMVAFSQLPNMEAQAAIVRELQEVVGSTNEFQLSAERRELLCRPTGDGMALIFFRDMLAPTRCAVEIANALKSRPHIRLRMGLHSGPVYVVKDINANSDVSGEGIVTAQRVMDCGDAGHILLSSQVAELLGNAVPWSGYLHDLGQCPVKHGKQLHLFNLYSKDFGNRRTPPRLRAARKEARGPSPLPGLLKRAASLALSVAVLGAVCWALWPRVQILLAAQRSGQNPTSGVALAATRKISANKRPHGSSARHAAHTVAPRAGNADEMSATPEEAAFPPPRLLPGDVADNTVVGTDGTGTNEEDVHVFDRYLSIPDDRQGLRQVRVEYTDARMSDPGIAVDEKFNEGEKVPLHFEVSGRHVTLRVFYDDKLIKEWKLDLQPIVNAGND